MILTAGKGKNKRTWELNDEEFEEFESRFEENEVIDMTNFDISGFKLTKVEPPTRRNA